MSVLLATAASETVSLLNILTSERASRHSGVQVLRIRPPKSAPKLTCFVHFHFQMCFSPQRRAFFDIRTSKSASENEVSGPFSLENALFATAECIFSTSELQKAVQT